MGITRGFGFTFDMATGRNRTWYMGEDGVKHYMDEPAADEPVSNADESTHPQGGGDGQ